ncbi:uncharacterized protein [Primulina eburnea]|uniref:uncharacterized protein n=1 Tax=Primulina eburnea TaxID=1245227 RepID=UPI003C6CB795
MGPPRPQGPQKPQGQAKKQGQQKTPPPAAPKPIEGQPCKKCNRLHYGPCVWGYVEPLDSLGVNDAYEFVDQEIGAYGLKLATLTWKQFKDVFYGKYFPADIRGRLTRELMSLRRGYSSVAEFIRKFDRSCHFVPLIARDAVQKMRHFMDGLGPILRRDVMLMRTASYDEATACAFQAEQALWTLILRCSERCIRPSPEGHKAADCPKNKGLTSGRAYVMLTEEAEAEPDSTLINVWRRALRALPAEWDAKRTAIIESNKGDAASYDLDQLHGTLKTHELEVSTRKETKKDDDKVKAKGIALTSQLEDSDDEEMALLTRKFKRFMRSSNFNKKDKKIEKEVTCYNCQQKGHYANECPSKKKAGKDKKKALLATWSDSDNEEESTLCFMAKEDHLTDSDDDEGQRGDKSSSTWYLDSGCSRHMTGEKKLLQSIRPKEKGSVTFGDNSKGIIEGIGSIGISNSTIIDDLFRSMIGSLLYATASRPDIMFSVCLCARFQSCPKESHLFALKRIFKYLSNTPNLGLWYSKNSFFDLKAYCDADFGGYKVDRKSTSGTCFFLGNCLVSWFSKKQNCVALSTTEAEYMAAGSCCAQILWMKYQLLDYGVTFSKIPIFCDNTSTICLTKNPVQHSRTKHIDIRHHFIRDHIEQNDVELHYVDTKNQIADIFTKPLDESTFTRLRGELGMIEL